MAGVGMETASPSPGVTAGAPRLKFLCSYGGKILPRPSDGQLKYVGGETRVVAVPRSVTFSEMREKIASVFRAEAVIKYQMASEDLDALVSVTCDEDLHHMLEEYDRLEARWSSSCTHPRLRVFLFPVPTPTATPPFEAPSAGGNPHHPHRGHPHLQLTGAALEQRYIDAINGAAVTRTPPGLPSPRGGLTIVPPATRPVFAESSAETSPTSSGEAIGRDTHGALACAGLRVGWRHGGCDGGGGRALQDILRVRSSPNLQHNHWPQQQNQQQQGLRLQVFHGAGAAVEYDASGSAVGNALRWPPPGSHPGAVYYSPVQTPRQQCGASGPFCGHAVDELYRLEERG